MKKQSIILSLFLLLGFGLQAQYEVDALRYSRLNHGGTARSAALSGAFGALGGDITTLNTNPGGIAMYRSSEFVFTPNLRFGRSKSLYYDDYSNESYVNASIDNLGLVLAFKPKENSVVKRVQVGFALNRLADFSNKIGQSRFMEEGGRADYLAKQADGNYFGSLGGLQEMAWKTYLIDTIENSDQYYYNDLDEHNYQKNIHETSGDIDEFSISAGANIADKIYLGASLGFPKIEYQELNYFTESDKENISDYFRDFTIKDTYTASGRGFNAKIGAIARPVNWLRIGAAYHSPTIYQQIDEEWYTEMTTNFDQNIGGDYTHTDKTSKQGWKYQLITPSRLIGSAAILVGKVGLLSLEYEYVDYKNARIEAHSDNPTDDYSIDNESVESSYRAVGNIKTGAEVRLGPVSLRGGFAFYPSPYKNNINDDAITSYSGGIGFRGEAFFLDLAYVYSDSKDTYYVYDPTVTSLNSPANNTYKRSQTMLTLGFRF